MVVNYIPDWTLFGAAQNWWILRKERKLHVRLFLKAVSSMFYVMKMHELWNIPRAVFKTVVDHTIPAKIPSTSTYVCLFGQEDITCKHKETIPKLLHLSCHLGCQNRFFGIKALYCQTYMYLVIPKIWKKKSDAHEFAKNYNMRRYNIALVPPSELPELTIFQLGIPHQIWLWIGTLTIVVLLLRW